MISCYSSADDWQLDDVLEAKIYLEADSCAGRQSCLMFKRMLISINIEGVQLKEQTLKMKSDKIQDTFISGRRALPTLSILGKPALITGRLSLVRPLMTM